MGSDRFREEMPRRQFIKVAAGATGGAVAASMLGPGRASASTAMAVAHQARGTLTVGVPYPLTGLAAAYQYLLPNAYVAVEAINKAGGIAGRTVKLDLQDDQSEPSQDPIVLTKLAASNIDYVLGPPGSSDVLASLAVTTPHKMLQSGWGDDVAFGNGSKYPYFYQVVYNTNQEVALYVDYLVKQRHITKIGILQENTAFGSAATAEAVRLIKKLGATVVSSQEFPDSVTDLSVQVQKVKEAGAKGLLMFIAPLPTMTAAYRALASLHWFPLTAGHDFVYSSLLGVVPKSATRQFVTISYAPLTYTRSHPIGKQQRTFAKKLAGHKEIQKIGPAIVIQAPHWDWLHILKYAIEKAHSLDTTKVKGVLDHMSGYQGMLGTFGFTRTQHTGIASSSLTLGVLGSLTDHGSQGGFFLERAPGL